MPSLPRMKTVKLLAVLGAALLLAACGPKTVIDGTLQDKAGAPVIVKLLDVNRYQVLDTVKTDAAGAFTFWAGASGAAAGRLRAGRSSSAGSSTSSRTGLRSAGRL